MLSHFGVSSGATINSVTRFVEGRLYINDDITFVNSVFWMAPGAQIIVLPERDFELIGTQVAGCGFMWKNILLESTATIVSDRNTLISDAGEGIWVNPNCNVSIDSTTFSDCVTGIYLPPLQSGTNGSDLFVTASTFTCTGSFKAYYPGQAPHSTRGRAGIILNQLGADTCIIGGVSGVGNLFSNMNNGIVSYATSVKIQNCRFENIYRDNFYFGKNGGYAVFADGSGGVHQLMVRPWIAQAATNPTIYNCNGGIYVISMECDILSTRMHPVDNGIFIARSGVSFARSVYIVSNHIEANQSGIQLLLNDGAELIHISENTIHISNPGGRCISAQDAGSGLSHLQILNNPDLTCENGGVGIIVRNLQEPMIAYNNIHYPNNSTGYRYRGISLENCHTAEVSCNAVNGPAATGTDSTVCLFQSLSTGSYIGCNSFNQTLNGVIFGGQNAGTNFKGNAFYDHNIGLELKFQAVIGQQNHTGNLWIGNYGSTGQGFGAYMTSPVIQSSIASKFFVSNTIGTILHPNNNANLFVWFDTTIAGSPFDCSEHLVCNNAASRETDTVITDFDWMIVNDEYDPEYFPNESESMAKHFLYKKLTLYPDLKETDSRYQDFYDDYAGTIIAGQTAFQLSLGELTEIGDTYAAMREQLQNDYSAIEEQLEAAEAAEDTVAVEQLEIQLTNMDIAIGNLGLQAEHAYGEAIQELVLENQAQIPVELPEVNENIINEIYLEYITPGKEFTSGIIDSIWQIAQQCPYSGGHAVYRARAIYELIEPDILYNDEDVCLLQGMYRDQQTVQASTVQSLLVKPNPASTKVTVTFLVGGESGCYLHITDLAGQTVKTIPLHCKQTSHSFSTADVTPGIYMLRLLNQQECIGTAKLTIIR